MPFLDFLQPFKSKFACNLRLSVVSKQRLFRPALPSSNTDNNAARAAFAVRCLPPERPGHSRPNVHLKGTFVGNCGVTYYVLDRLKFC